MANTLGDNQHLADSIAMLEQILEVMPQDSDAIRALYSAYLKGGQAERAYEHLKRLVEITIDNGDAELLHFVQGELQKLEAVNPAEVAAYIARLRTLESSDSSRKESGEERKSGEKEPLPKSSETDISEELALAWRLYEEEQLSQEEYSSVLHDLTEVSSKELDVPVSVLHVLQDRNFTQIARIINYLSTRSGVPFLKLEGFELDDKLATVLPLNYPMHEGALPFAFLGNHLLVGVLNPFNHLLTDRIEKESGHPCHTYLIEPEDYDLVLGKLKELNA